MYSSVLKQKSGQFAISISFLSDSGVSCLKTLEVWHSEVSWRSWRDVHGDDYDIEDEIDDDDDDWHVYFRILGDTVKNYWSQGNTESLKII